MALGGPGGTVRCLGICSQLGALWNLKALGLPGGTGGHSGKLGGAMRAEMHCGSLKVL